MKRILPLLLLALALDVRADSVVWPAPPPGTDPSKVVVCAPPVTELDDFLDEVKEARSRQVELIIDGDFSVYEYDTILSHDWNNFFPRVHPVVFRGGETCIQLWHLQHGELSGLHPRLIVLSTGLDNLYEGDSPEDVLAAVQEIIGIYRLKCPDAHIVLLGILHARDQNRDLPPKVAPLIDQADALLAKLDDHLNVSYLDLRSRFAGTVNLDDQVYYEEMRALKPFIDQYCLGAASNDQAPYPQPITNPEPVLTWPFNVILPPGARSATTPAPFGFTLWPPMESRPYSGGTLGWAVAFMQDCKRFQQTTYDVVVDGYNYARCFDYWSRGQAAAYVFGTRKAVHLDSGDALDTAPNPVWEIWRLRNGMLNHQDPKLVVICPDNREALADKTAPRLAPEIQALIHEYETECPQSQIVLFGISPLGQQPGDPARVKTDRAEEQLKALTADPRVRFVDLYSQVLDQDGTLKDNYFKQTDDKNPDWLEPQKPVFQLWHDDLQPLLNQYCPAPKPQ